MPGKSPLLCFAIGVITKASLLLKMENERPDFMLADSVYICAYSLRSKEVLKVINAISHDAYSIGAFTFGGGTELIPLE